MARVTRLTFLYYIIIALLSVSDENITLQRVTPLYVVLRPPDKLVLEVLSSGRYREIRWEKLGKFGFDESRINHTANTGITLFEEVLFLRHTSSEDLTIYFVTLVPNTDSPYQQSQVIRFDVIPHGMLLLC